MLYFHGFVVVSLAANKEIKFDAIDSVISCGECSGKSLPNIMHILHAIRAHFIEKVSPKKKTKKNSFFIWKNMIAILIKQMLSDSI